MANLVKVGKISTVHGIKGEVKLSPYGDLNDLEDILRSGVKDIFLDSKPYEIESFRKHKTVVLLKLHGVDTRNASEELKGLEVEISDDLLPELKEGEYYLSDLIGIEVKTEEEVLGKLKDVMNAGAGDVYVITPDGGSKGNEDILLPANEETILEINPAEGFIKVKVPEGLLS